MIRSLGGDVSSGSLARLNGRVFLEDVEPMMCNGVPTTTLA
jgi:hypothetical protein